MSADVAKCIDAAVAARRRSPAKNAEMQNTITRVMFVLRPIVATRERASRTARAAAGRAGCGGSATTISGDDHQERQHHVVEAGRRVGRSTGRGIARPLPTATVNMSSWE